MHALNMAHIRRTDFATIIARQAEKFNETSELEGILVLVMQERRFCTRLSAKGALES